MVEGLKEYSVQFSSVTQSCPTLCNPANRSTPGLPVHYQLPELTQTHVHQVGDAIQPSHPLSSLLLLPPIPPSIRVFSNESTLRVRWPKYWSFSFSISPSNEHPGLISLRMDWLDLLAVKRTLKSLLQHHSSKASIGSSQIEMAGMNIDILGISELKCTGISALASFFPKNTQGWSPSEWTGWISLQSKGLSRVFSNTTVQKHHFFSAQPSSQFNSHIHTWP